MLDQSRNLSMANSNLFKNSFSVMKENQDHNIIKNNSHNNSSILNSKLFKFKKRDQPRHLGDNLSSNPFSNLINIEGE